jgi:hypothetical protein
MTGPKKKSVAAQEGEQQVRARAGGADDLGRDDLEVQRASPPQMPAKKPETMNAR